MGDVGHIGLNLTVGTDQRDAAGGRLELQRAPRQLDAVLSRAVWRDASAGCSQRCSAARSLCLVRGLVSGRNRLLGLDRGGLLLGLDRSVLLFGLDRGRLLLGLERRRLLSHSDGTADQQRKHC